MKQYIALLFLFLNLACSSQLYYDDAQLWTTLNLEKKVTKKFSVQLSLKGRGINNVSQFGRAAADIGVCFKLTKNIKLLADYVFIQKKKKSDFYKTEHQYYAALIFKKDIARWRFSYRNMFQCRYKNPLTSNDGYIAYYYNRNKVTVKHETTKRISFYVSEEVAIPLNNPEVKGLSRSRSYIGTAINTTKHQQLELYFMVHVQLQNSDWYNQDDSYSVNPPKRNFVYGLSYSIEF